MKLFSTILSYIFHPLLIPTYGTLLLFEVNTHMILIPYEGKKLIFWIVFTCTLALPVLFIPLFLFTNIIKSPEMAETKERIIPLMVTFLLYYAGFLFLKSLPLPFFFKAFILSATIIVFLVLIISYFWKISAHLSGLGGITGAFTAMSITLNQNITSILIIMIIISGIVASVRLFKQSHNPPQIYTGWLSAFFIAFITVILYSYF